MLDRQEMNQCEDPEKGALLHERTEFRDPRDKSVYSFNPLLFPRSGILCESCWADAVAFLLLTLTYHNPITSFCASGPSHTDTPFAFILLYSYASLWKVGLQHSTSIPDSREIFFVFN